MDDRSLVRRCIDGDDQAWDAFFRRYSPLVKTAAREVLRRFWSPNAAAEAEEIVSRVFERLLEEDRRRLRSFGWRCGLPRWLVLVTQNEVRQYLRESSRRRRHEQVVEPHPSENAGARRAVPLRQIPGDFSADEIRSEVQAALSVLPEEDRYLLTSLYFDGKTFRELASELRLPLGTLANRVKTAKDHFQKNLNIPR